MAEGGLSYSVREPRPLEWVAGAAKWGPRAFPCAYPRSTQCEGAHSGQAKPCISDRLHRSPGSSRLLGPGIDACGGLAGGGACGIGCGVLACCAVCLAVVSWGRA